MGLLELGCEAKENGLARGGPDQLNRCGQPVHDLEWHGGRRLAGYVDDRGERRDLTAAPELLPRVVRLEDPAYRDGQLRERRRQHDVDVVPEGDDPTRAALERTDGPRELDARGLACGTGEHTVERHQQRLVRYRIQRRRQLPECC